mgnify:CR=1 FL=1
MEIAPPSPYTSVTVPKIGEKGDDADLNGLTFGQDAEGNWGYKPPGADAVIPFKSMPDGLREIRLLADPQGYGTVSGGGMAADGMTVTVHAKANEDGNYLFDGWKEGGARTPIRSRWQICGSPVYSIRAVGSFVAVIRHSNELTVPVGDGIPFRGNGKFVAVARGTNKMAYSSAKGPDK